MVRLLLIIPIVAVVALVLYARAEYDVGHPVSAAAVVPLPDSVEPLPVEPGLQRTSEARPLDADADVEFVIESSMLVISARDPNGYPLFGVTYRTRIGGIAKSATPDELTFFARRFQPGKPGWVVVGYPGHVPVRLDIAPANAQAKSVARAVVMRPAPDNSLTLWVQGSDGVASPAKSVRVEVLDHDGVSLRYERLPLRDGKATLRDLMPGPARLRVYTHSNEASDLKELTILTRTVQEVVFRMPPAGEVRVRWKKTESDSRLKLERLDGTPVETWFSQAGGEDWWITTSMLAYGNYVLVEFRGRARYREQTFKIERKYGTTVHVHQ